MRVLTTVCAVIFAFPLFAIAKSQVCGGMVTTLWNVDFAKKQLRLRLIRKNQSEKFCEFSMLKGGNASVQILDMHQKLVREIKTFIPVFSENDGIKKKSPATRLRFANDSEFARAKFIKVILPNGDVYGPAPF